MATQSSLSFQPSFSTLGEQFISYVTPEPLEQCRAIHINRPLAQQYRIADNFDFSQLLEPSGNHANPAPFASVYSGHQFGVWAGQLGDGRATTLGNLVSANANDNDSIEVQLKGAGKTPYSRFADGRAVLRSTIREYLAGEALYRLGIPSTRALAILSSQTAIYRERAEKAALLVRCAKTHIRFGHFEHFYYSNQHRQLSELADFVKHNFYPQCADYAQMFQNIVLKTASLIAHWQAYGFCHGVLNTDNMSIIGNTLDYGPYGFMETFNPDWICNHSDHNGRYSYKNQPAIGLWNCNALARAMSPLIETEQLKAALQLFEAHFYEVYYRLLKARLGLDSSNESHRTIADDFLKQLAQQQLDMNISFLKLEEHYDQPEKLIEYRLDSKWVADYVQLNPQFTANANPRFILRNYMAQEVIGAAEQGDYQLLEALFKVLTQPFDSHSNYDHWQGEPPQWASQLELSCSS